MPLDQSDRRIPDRFFERTIAFGQALQRPRAETRNRLAEPDDPQQLLGVFPNRCEILELLTIMLDPSVEAVEPNHDGIRWHHPADASQSIHRLAQFLPTHYWTMNDHPPSVRGEEVNQMNLGHVLPEWQEDRRTGIDDERSLVGYDPIRDL